MQPSRAGYFHDRGFCIRAGDLAGGRGVHPVRGRQDGNPLPVLAVALTAEQPSRQSLRRLEHEYSLASDLDPAWAARPLALTRHEARSCCRRSSVWWRPALRRWSSSPATPASANPRWCTSCTRCSSRPAVSSPPASSISTSATFAYATLAQAFQSLVRPLLGQSEAELGR